MPVQSMDFLTPDLLPEQQAIERRRKLADVLLGQSMNEPRGQMVGGVYVAPSPVQGLARLFQAYAGARGGERTDQEMKDLYTQAQQRRQADIGSLISGLPVPRMETERTDQEGTGSMDMSGSTGPKQILRMPTPQDYTQFAARAMQSPYQEMNRLGMGIIGNQVMMPNPNANLARLDPAHYTPDSWNAYVSSGGDTRLLRAAVTPSSQLTADVNRERLAQRVREFTGLSAAQRAQLDQKAAQLGISAQELFFNTGMQMPTPAGPSAAPQNVGPLPSQGTMPAPSGIVAPNAGAQPPIPGFNFGNLRPPGATTGFQSFANPQEGLAALDRQLESYGRQGLNTVAGIIGRYAPPNENNTQAYVNAVSQRLGIKPDQPLDLTNPAARQALSTAIMLQEHGPSRIFAQGPTGTSAPLLPTRAPLSPKTQQELAVAQPKERQAATSMLVNSDNILNQIDKIEKSALGGVTGTVFGYAPSIRQSSVNAQAEIDTLLGMLGIEKLQQMRQESKSGGAVGQVTEREWPILQNAIGNLRQRQDEASFRRNLGEVKTIINRMKELTQRAYQDRYGTLEYESPFAKPTPAGSSTANTKTVIKFSDLPSGR